MKWKKRGFVFAPTAEIPWMRTHAALPMAAPISDQEVAVYFSARDSRGRSQIGRLDLNPDLSDPIRRLYAEPVIGLGPLGAFDDSGVTPGCILEHQGKQYLFYSGWSLGVTVPFYFFVGLAVSEDGGKTFEKVSAAPVLGRSAADPFLTASPSVMIEDGVWRMWYVSCVRWVIENDAPKHYYHIKYTESADGVHWNGTRHVSVDFVSDEEYAIGRPCVRKESGLYRMWYCYRGPSYRIGYAESSDGISWRRRDQEAGIDLSTSGWDSEMQAYPWVFRHGRNDYMLYNGNGYGKSGFGMAIRSDAGSSPVGFPA